MNLCIRGFNPLISPVLLLALSVWIAISAQAAAAQTQEPVPASVESKSPAVRRVKVQVTITCDDNPVASVPFTAQYDRAFGEGVTDADGRAELVVDVPVSARMVAVYPRHWPSSGGKMLNIQQSRAQYLQLIAPYAFTNWYRVELRPDEGSYELSIEVSRARKATLHVEPPERPGIGAIAISRSTVYKLNNPDDQGRIVVAGLPKDKPSVIYVMSKKLHGHVARIEVPADEADVDLGNVPIPPSLPADCEVRITSKWDTGRLWNPDLVPGGITLVSLDGERVLTMTHAQRFAHAVFNQGDPALPKVPAGEYYVVGGIFGASLAQASLVERARSGEDLRKLHVPTIIASPDRIAELEIDQWNVEKLILGGEDNTDRPDYIPPRP